MFKYNRCLLILLLAGNLCLFAFAQEPETRVNNTPVESTPVSDQRVIIVVGAGGTEEYATTFQSWGTQWKRSAAHTRLSIIGANETDGEAIDNKTEFRKLVAEAKTDKSIRELWIVLIGHGTFDGQQAKFNLSGPDVSATELATWLGAPGQQRQIIINSASCSSPFINVLSGRNRIVVTATRDGSQYNFARLGKHLSQSINEPAIDLDKDGQTSLLEAFCAANTSTQDFYRDEKRLATEHALIDDNGDKLGTPGDWFTGITPNTKPKKGLSDGLLANQVFLQRRGETSKLSAEARQRRDQLELELARLQQSRSKLDESQYLASIEPIMIQLAELYSQTDDHDD